MADFYTEMAGVARSLLSPTSQGGLGQGKIELVRYTPGPPPANEWDPPSAPVRNVTLLNGAARGVSKEMIGTEVAPGTAIISTDLIIIVAPWAGAYEPGEVLELDAKPVIILKVENIPAVGILSAVRFIVRK